MDCLNEFWIMDGLSTIQMDSTNLPIKEYILKYVLKDFEDVLV